MFNGFTEAKREELWEICKDVYRRLYGAATPSADFDELLASDESSQSGWFNNYYLVQEKQDKIIEEELKKHNLKKKEEKAVRKELYLGCAPNGYRKVVA